ncbi:hypothetical protein EVAR_83965_1 [Eumeta japonica]|uniref:Uncharacterized protein n=1 Tax=Eumeta variegata TaxID=151549 RepID=A0A4C1VR34_EUMVA|nr:hypothetical protein EVAR_83965_1 [Eumeta japonica]
MDDETVCFYDSSDKDSCCTEVYDVIRSVIIKQKVLNTRDVRSRKNEKECEQLLTIERERISTRGEHLCGGEANIVWYAYRDANNVWSFCR